MPCFLALQLLTLKPQEHLVRWEQLPQGLLGQSVELHREHLEPWVTQLQKTSGTMGNTTSATSNSGSGAATDGATGMGNASGAANVGTCTDINGKTISSTHSDYSNCLKARKR